jgi:hypothetical protein
MSNAKTAHPEKTRPEQAASSRRSFLLSSATGAALAAGMVVESKAEAAAASIPSISIPKEVIESIQEAPKPGSFEGQGMTGAEVFAKTKTSPRSSAVRATIR